MPAAREFNGNFTVFFIGKANPSGPPARQTLHSGSEYLASWFGRPCQAVGRAAYSHAPSIKDMGIDHGWRFLWKMMNLVRRGN